MPKLTRRRFLVHSAGFGAMLLGAESVPHAGPPIRVGVIGLGPAGRAHLRALTHIKGVRVTAICDDDPTALRTASRNLSASSAMVTDFRRVLDHRDIDLVAITPSLSGSRVLEQAVSSGKHVVIGAPDAFSLDEASRLHQLASTLPSSVAHFPADPSWDSDALVPWLQLDGSEQVEVHALFSGSIAPSKLDVFDIALRLLGSAIPRRCVALGAPRSPFTGCSAEVELGGKRITLHESRRALPAGLDRRTAISVHGGRHRAMVRIDSWVEDSPFARPPCAAWSRAIALIANGDRAAWIASTERTAAISATIQILEAARTRGEFRRIDNPQSMAAIS